MSNKLFKVFCFALLLFVSNSCKKDKPEEDLTSANTPKLVISDAEALPFQLISFQLENGLLANENAKTENIKIGDSTAVAYRTADNSIYAFNFALPELAPGKYTIAMQTDKGEAKAEITVKQYTPIADANKYIADYNTKLNSQFTQISLEYDTKVQDGTMRQSTADSLKDFVKKAHDKSAALLAQLPEAEKKKFAYMYEANKKWLNDYNNAMAQHPFMQSGKKQEDPCATARYNYNVYRNEHEDNRWKQYYRQQLNECEAQQEKARLEAQKTFNGKINAAYAKAKEEMSKTPGKLTAAFAFVSSYVSEAAKGIFEIATGIKDVDDPFAPLNMEDTKNEKKNTISFIANQESDLLAGVNFTNLNRQNTNVSPAFPEMIANIDNHTQTMENLGQFLPYVPEMNVPAAKTQKIYFHEFTIDQISKSNITVQIIDKPEGKKVKFSIKDPETEKTSFTFRMTVKTEFGEVSKVFEAELMDELKIGSKYKGGIIAYILQPDDPGYKAGELHGLIAAPTDLGKYNWGFLPDKKNLTFLGTLKALGTGKQNTELIVTECSENTNGEFAALACENLDLNGYDDWYLPSIDELNKLYINKETIGGFSTIYNGQGATDENVIYWSSSELENASSYVWYEKYIYGQDFSNGQINSGLPNRWSIRVRPVRSF